MTLRTIRTRSLLLGLVAMLAGYYFIGKPTSAQVMTVENLARSGSFVSWCDETAILSDDEHARRVGNAYRSFGVESEMKAKAAADAKLIYCTAFIHGFSQGHQLAATLGGVSADQRLSCTPKTVTVDQLARIWHKWLLEHPRTHHIEPGTTLWLSLMDSYPCEGAVTAEDTLKQLLARSSE
jgi:hypothetical protein